MLFFKLLIDLGGFEGKDQAVGGRSIRSPTLLLLNRGVMRSSDDLIETAGLPICCGIQSAGRGVLLHGPFALVW